VKGLSWSFSQTSLLAYDYVIYAMALPLFQASKTAMGSVMVLTDELKTQRVKNFKEVTHRSNGQ